MKLVQLPAWKNAPKSVARLNGHGLRCVRKGCYFDPGIPIPKKAKNTMNKRKGGAARLREKNKKQLLSLTNFNMKVDTLFKMQNSKSQISSIGIDKENDSNRNIINNDDVEIAMTTQSSTFSNSLIKTPEFKKDISMNKNEKPVQPMLLFYPKTNNRNFQSSYFNKFNWLEYSISDDVVFCFPCRHFSLSGNFRGQTIGNSLTKHSRSENHLTSVERWNQYLAIQATLYLTKQGLAFRGNDESSLSKNKGNFIELLETFADDSMKIRLKSRYGHYTSPEYQNDLIHILGCCTRKNILNKMSLFSIHSILVDETKDSSKKEQLSFLIRFVDINFNIFEKVLGCIMSGVYLGVQQKISEIVPHAVYIHCYAHRLNLCLVDCIQNVPLIVDFFDTIQNLYKYLMNSQTRYELFIEAQKNKNVKVINLERLFGTLRSRYTVIIEVLTFLTEHGDQIVKAVGLLKILSTFKFIMILEVMVSVLECIHCLSCELQNSNIILSKAMLLVKFSRNNILKLRCEESWLKFHHKATDIAICNGIKTQTHSKYEKRKQTFNKRLNDYFVQSTLGRARYKEKDVSSLKVELLYQVIDRIVTQLDERFSKNEQVFDIFNVFDYTNADFLNAECVAVNKFLDHYKGFKINSLSLPSEFSSIKAKLELENMSQFKLELIFNIVLNLPFAFPETIKILSIMLTLPVTTASNESASFLH
ncbi:hypothetical protein QTP88_024071 [Uroleucon formosanum]